jgi:hypothetical protein
MAKDGKMKTIWCDTKQEALAEINDKMCLSDLVTIIKVKQKTKAE